MLTRVSILCFLFILVLSTIALYSVSSVYAKNTDTSTKKNTDTSTKKKPSATKTTVTSVVPKVKKNVVVVNTTKPSASPIILIQINLVKNPDFLQSVKKNGVTLFANWNDSFSQCSHIYRCLINQTDGLIDKKSFQVSTASQNKSTWSWIRGDEINVKPRQQYMLTTNMKLNAYAVQSHIVLEGFNQTSKAWYPIVQCPSGINGPTGWKTYNCQITIPSNTFKIRPALNGGWSSHKNEMGTTWFDHIQIKLLKK
jgi:hypothetical protein